MNVSRIFIERPIGTALLAVGLFLAGVMAYMFLPVASMPSMEFPTIRVSVTRPGADPATMAASVAAPLERRLGEISGVTEMTSSSALGTSSITMQFELSRSADGAGRDVQAALNAATADLPGDLPQVPTFRKYNPSGSPVLILALTSDTMTTSDIYDTADTVIAQRISQVEGVADVSVSGADQPATRIQVDPVLTAAMGVSFEQVRQAIEAANDLSPIGSIDGGTQSIILASNPQLLDPEEYKNIVVKNQPNGDIVRVGDVAKVVLATRNRLSSAQFNNKPAVLLIITKTPEANVIETVDRVKALLPQLRQWIPAGIKISVLSDRTGTIRASVEDMQMTLAITILLVMSVVFVFLRRSTPTIAAGITVPLSLAGTCAAMWAAGYSINNLTLMAFAVAVGFVVDDAIVMIENVYRNMERGMKPMQAALEGARQIGFTVISISVSLIAAFIPVLFMTGIAGRLLHEFAMTLMFSIIISAIVSLTVTPMICAHFIRDGADHRKYLADRLFEGALALIIGAYAFTLRIALRHQAIMLAVFVATIALTVHLYQILPKGYLPDDDTGLIIAATEANTDTSFGNMSKLQDRALKIILADPAIESVGSSIGGGGFNPTLNQGRMFIGLKPLAERNNVSTAEVIDRLRKPLGEIVGLATRLMPSRDIRTGARQGKADYQYTLWSYDDKLYDWVAKAVAAVRTVPGVVDVSSDREQGGLQLNAIINRDTASKLNVSIADIDTALANAFSQRQFSTIYGDRNQYKVIIEVDPKLQRDPSDLNRIYVPSARGTLIPLSTLLTIERGTAPLVINHQGPFPSVTINYSLRPGVSMDTSLRGIEQALAELHMPESIRGEPAGDAKAFAEQARMQTMLILAAFVAIYIVLGVLYESLAHPLTIISTLPSAGLGALLALQTAKMDLSVIALIGVILLIGIVKKNGIMLVDFALSAERERGLSPQQSIYEACLQRFRPILMTTLAALLGAIPLAVAIGPGSEIRRPLGITIIGGLVVSQVLTLYTTPVIYLLLEKLKLRVARWRGKVSDVPAAGPAA
ncbi:Multidrug resistance protein mdtC (Multidrug transporter mdtC) [Hyphomicrobium sp. GJ21]|uniref:efflux RND transporter permease subunit n=1 Tax=Hyphomicrobium sp. GJ21 TaxID=113574 RepID=UPI000622C2F3|nr:efflux RND transporter permease subunit [Hyphomicrobium sp. GJ21]CEJ86036.1 Multidrug resistance protein mdtC (Multidrug transporter mdtC) [Hyphomicrobium sp. GJ21]